MLTAEETKMLKKVRLLEAELVRLTKAIVAIPTPDPPGENFDDLTGFLTRELKAIGLEVSTVQIEQDKLPVRESDGERLPRPNLLAKLKGKNDKAVLHLNGHYDVVAATGKWSGDPFKPVLKDGKIYGRGTTDMKGAIAAMIVAAMALADSNLKLGGSLTFSFCPDEENDADAGTKFLTSRNLIKADHCIVGEPSGSRGLWNAHKGCLWAKIAIRGRAAHGSVPWLGVNAFEKMVKLTNLIEAELKPKLERKISSYATFPPMANRPTINVGGMVRVDGAPNIVPELCTATVDRRLIPEETLFEAKSEIDELLIELKSAEPEVGVDVSYISEYEAAYTAPDSDLCEAISAAVEDVSGVRPLPTMCLGGCDMRYFVAAGIPTVIYGPGALSCAHQSDEFVEVRELVEAASVYALASARLLRATGT